MILVGTQIVCKRGEDNNKKKRNIINNNQVKKIKTERILQISKRLALKILKFFNRCTIQLLLFNDTLETI